MKKFTFLYFFLNSVFIYSQELATTESGKRVQLNKNGTYKYLSAENKETVLKDSDFTKLDETVRFKNKPFYVLNGDEKPTPINFSFGSDLNRFSSLSIDSINSMIAIANIKTMFKMKNRRTYIPKKISFFFVDKDSAWLIAIEYVANNDYGGQKDGVSYVSFTDIGEFKDILII